VLYPRAVRSHQASANEDRRRCGIYDSICGFCRLATRLVVEKSGKSAVIWKKNNWTECTCGSKFSHRFDTGRQTATEAQEVDRAVVRTDTGLKNPQQLKEGVNDLQNLLEDFQLLLHRYTGQDDYRGSVAHSPIANRIEIERLMGFCQHTVLRRIIPAILPPRSASAGAERRALEAYAHQDLRLRNSWKNCARIET